MMYGGGKGRVYIYVALKLTFWGLLQVALVLLVCRLGAADSWCASSVKAIYEGDKKL